MKTLCLLPAVAAICLLSGTASAQTAPSYTSPIADYQKFVDEKVLPWKAANDKVAEIGGWRAYAKEAQANAELASATPTTASKADILSAEQIAKAPMPVRTAWLQAVAKQEQLVYAKQVHASAQASSELAKTHAQRGQLYPFAASPPTRHVCRGCSHAVNEHARSR